VNRSSIEWTGITWNPVTGCTKVSPGCDHCYAEAFAERFRGVPGHAYERGFDLQLRPERLEQPLGWSTPSLIFVNSMSDLLHAEVPEAFIARVVEVMRAASWHSFQVLTKRGERLERLSRRLRWPANVWLGVSVEASAFYGRIGHLQRVDAGVRFLSCEPLLDPLDRLPLAGIDWVIAGGESGRGARPMQPWWVRQVRDQCVAAGIPFFFKQWGAWAPDDAGGDAGDGAMRRLTRRQAGRLLDGRTWDELPLLAAARAMTGEGR
jgi:protein gp37